MESDIGETTRRIAIIADTHGNLVALDTVLCEIEAEGINQTICLGDTAGLGPQPHATLARLREVGCHVVMGNADEFMLDPSLVDPARHPDVDKATRRLHDMERWAAAQLTDEDRAYLRTFRPTIEVNLGDGTSLLCYHGSPRSAWEEIRASTPDAELATLLGSRRALVMAGGHTHEQFVRRLGQSIVMNPGSVGLPCETLPDCGGRNPPWAEYAVFTVGGGRLSIELRRVSVDVVAIRQALRSSGMPHAELWASDWR